MNKEISLDERIEKLLESGWVNEFNYLENQLQEARYLVCVLQKENQQLKKQKDDVVEYIKNNFIEGEVFYSKSWLKMKKKDLLRMLGEIDVED